MEVCMSERLSSLWQSLREAAAPSGNAPALPLPSFMEDGAPINPGPSDDFQPPSMQELPPEEDFPSGYAVGEMVVSSTQGYTRYRATGPGGREVTLLCAHFYYEGDVQRWRNAWDNLRTLRHPFILEPLGCWTRGDSYGVMAVTAARCSLAHWLWERNHEGQGGVPAGPLLWCLRG